jgi:hypothetical protein
MGSISYTEYKCDRCGAGERVEWHMGKEDDDEKDSGWRLVAMRDPESYEADEPAVLVCPVCVERVRAAVAAALKM